MLVVRQMLVPDEARSPTAWDDVFHFRCNWVHHARVRVHVSGRKRPHHKIWGNDRSVIRGI